MLRYFLLLRYYLYPLCEYASYKSRVFSIYILPLFWRFFWYLERRLETIELGKKGTSLLGSERALLIQEVLYRLYNPRILEVGIGYGQNISVLVELLPQEHIYGIDLKQTRIEETRHFLSQHGISQVMLSEGDGRRLEFDNDSFDVVFTSAVMLYLTYADAKRMLSELLRVSRQRVVLLEQHRAQEKNLSLSGGVTGEDYYVRDYHMLISEVLSDLNMSAHLKMLNVPNPRWQVESWKDSACVFVIEKKEGSGSRA